MNNYAETIAAISTPPGKGGVAIIRISGDDAAAIGDKIFIPVSNKRLTEHAPRMLVRGDVYCGGEMIDDGMAAYFKAPASYTGEDTVEIYCHGGVLVAKTVLEAALAAGAMPAGAGEFTRRAFINGRLSLTEAEAIGNLLEAESLEQIKLASGKSREILTQKIEEIRKTLTTVLSSIYARIDYPDEDLGDFSDEEAREMLVAAGNCAKKLLSTYQTGRAISAGIKTALCGKPNVGKSSIYNLLVGHDAAIVTDIEGTTRDVLTEKISLGRIMLNLSDTAGVRNYTADPIEKIGIERSRERIRESELILAVFDLSRPADSEDEALIHEISEAVGTKIAILNKKDLEEKFDRECIADTFDEIIEISAENERDEALGELIKITERLFTDEKITVGSDAIISSARQSAELSRAISLIDSAIAAFDLGLSQDAASSDVERALGAIAELDGKAVSEAVVADIFARFCVGK